MIKLIACGLLLFPFISSQSPTSVNIESRSIEEAKIAEAVYHYQIQQCHPEMADKIYFLGLYDGKDEKDPTDELMKGFKGHNPPVKKHSQMLHAGKNNEFMDKESGRPAVLLSIEKIEWQSETKVEGRGLMWRGRLVCGRL